MVWIIIIVSFFGFLLYLKFNQTQSPYKKARAEAKKASKEYIKAYKEHKKADIEYTKAIVNHKANKEYIKIHNELRKFNKKSVGYIKTTVELNKAHVEYNKTEKEVTLKKANNELKKSYMENKKVAVEFYKIYENFYKAYDRFYNACKIFYKTSERVTTISAKNKKAKTRHDHISSKFNKVIWGYNKTHLNLGKIYTENDKKEKKAELKTATMNCIKSFVKLYIISSKLKTAKEEYSQAISELTTSPLLVKKARAEIEKMTFISDKSNVISINKNQPENKKLAS